MLLLLEEEHTCCLLHLLSLKEKRVLNCVLSAINFSLHWHSLPLLRLTVCSTSTKLLPDCLIFCLTIYLTVILQFKMCILQGSQFPHTEQDVPLGKMSLRVTLPLLKTFLHWYPGIFL